MILEDCCCILIIFRLHDTRHPHKATGSTNTRATSGVTVDPSCDFRLAGDGDTMLQIWDTRNFEKPIISLDMERPVSRVSWCPTRPGLLASVGRDSGSVSCH